MYCNSSALWRVIWHYVDASLNFFVSFCFNNCLQKLTMDTKIIENSTLCVCLTYLFADLVYLRLRSCRWGLGLGRRRSRWSEDNLAEIVAVVHYLGAAAGRPE